MSSDTSRPLATCSSTDRRGGNGSCGEASHQPQPSAKEKMAQVSTAALIPAAGVPTPLRVRRPDSSSTAAKALSTTVALPENAAATAAGPSNAATGAQSSDGASAMVGTAPPPWTPGSGPGGASSYGNSGRSEPKGRARRRPGCCWDHPLSNQEKRERIRLLYEQDVQDGRYQERRLEDEVARLNEEKRSLEAIVQQQAEEGMHPMEQMAADGAHQRELSALASMKVLAERLLNMGALGELDEAAAAHHGHMDVPCTGTLRIGAGEMGQLTSAVQRVEHRLAAVLDRLDRAGQAPAAAPPSARSARAALALRSGRGEAAPASARALRPARLSAVTRSRTRQQPSVSCCFAGLWRTRSLR